MRRVIWATYCDYVAVSNLCKSEIIFYIIVSIIFENVTKREVGKLMEN